MKRGLTLARKVWADGRWICRGRAIWSAKFVGREISAEADRLFPGSTGTVGPFRYESADRGRSSLFVRAARTVLSRKQSGRASRSFPARPDGRPVGNCSAKIFARPRPMFGADCVFTPFSPSILS
ncbi:unnamed protein product [Microthlaspi erraticum]|uniref:Uncharacterized protein n=1 Tax=Microthlaspi erraticum TaxID=1685480 RepID=A0A6D2L0Y8_9BRAS|nr:unnamed protein product [Microthlaspi erraticum]